MKLRSHKFLWFLIILVFFVGNCANAQMIRHLTHSDGLPSSSVLSAMSARNGLLWIGTIDGLGFYDGYAIHSFNSKYTHGTLSGNIIHSIHETDQAIWIQTNYGLDRMSKYHDHLDEFPDFRENYTFMSESGNIIFSRGSSGKIYYYIDGVSKTFLPLEGVSLNRHGQPSFTCRGDTLRVYSDTGIKSFVLGRKGESEVILLKQLQQQPMEIDKCFPDYDGKVWITDQKGIVWLYDPTTGDKQKYADLRKECESRGPIFSIARRKNSHDVFVGFQWNDVIKLHDNEDNAEPSKMSLGINAGMNLITPDINQEVIWITTDGQGVYEYIDAEVSISSVTYADINHIVRCPARAIWADDEETLWVGTKGDGIMRLRNFKTSIRAEHLLCEVMDPANSALLNKEVYAFAPSHRPVLWIGTGGGINYYSYSERRIKVLPFPDKNFPKDIHSIYEESENVIWVAASGQGIYRIELSGSPESPVAIRMKEFSNDNGNWSMNFFFAIHPGENGVIYGVNRGYGAVAIRDDEMMLQPLCHDYHSRMVNDMYAIEIQGDTIWYGTGAGVIRKYGDEETLFDCSSGLTNATVHALGMDGNSGLWISTNDGLARLDTSTGVMRLYNHSAGVEVSEFSDGAFCRNGNDLYFGGVDGIVRVSIGNKSLPVNVDYSPVYFTGLTINGVWQGLNCYRPDKKLFINSAENSFSIDLASPDHINGSHYSFYYKLDKDKEWNLAENHRVNFSHLPYGTYKLLARYVDNATGFTSPVYTLDMEVHVPWYMSWWAKTVYFLLIVALITFVVVLLLWRQREIQKRKIKELKQEQKEKMYENKLRFFTGITHEFSAPLTLIYGPCERILNHRGIDSYTERYVNLIRHNAERLNSLIQEIIDFGRIESGVMPRVVTEVNVSVLCADTIQMFSSLEEQNSIHLERDIQPEVVWPTDIRSFTKILYNLLSNAFKYTPSFGTIRLSLHRTDNTLQLRVFNSGNGIEERHRKRIFDRYTVFENMERNATKGLSSRNGIGMATCQAMVELLEGEIKVESEIGKYAEFIVELPLLPLSSSTEKEVVPESMPLVQNQPVEMPTPEIPAHSAPKTGSNDGNQNITILIIDDDAEILHLLHDSMAEFEIYTATNAQAGLKIVTDKNPNLIITDIMMAGEGGIWFTKKVKENRHTAHIPIVMLSAKNTSVDKIAGLKAGADAYVAKPFSTAYLLEVVKRLLSSRGELKDYYNSSASAFEYMDGKALSQNDKDFVNRLKELVEESICEPDLTADILAEKMNMSLRNLYRRMKVLQLPPPIDFIRQHRLKHAAHLLATTSISIQDVFIQSGFNNRSYFYKEFDKLYGMTPRAYRIQKQEELKNANPKNKKT